MKNPPEIPAPAPTDTGDGEVSAASSCSLSFVVIAFRYGGNDNVFPIGSFRTRKAAEEAASEHRNYRGWKYEHRIYEFTADEWNDDIGHATNRLPCIEANA